MPMERCGVGVAWVEFPQKILNLTHPAYQFFFIFNLPHLALHNVEIFYVSN